MAPRVLIVGTVPFNKKSTSRAFESYFSNWESENLAQIFSNTKKPAKGHCSTLFQITDQRLVKKRLKHTLETGVIYYDKDLADEWSDNTLEVNSSIFSKLYNWGSKKRPIVYLMRRLVWNKKYWCTEKLNKWLDEFNPECVFLSFSDDFFISEIALYVAERFNIPIVSSIGDDYYFNTKFSLSPFYYLYKLKYKKLIREVFKHPGSAIYIGDKIRDKYNQSFGLDGETVYLSSSIKRREFKEIDVQKPTISYFGNIRLGRNHSLNDIGYALGEVNPNYILNVYSNETDPSYFKVFNENKNISYHGSIPYSEVQSKTVQSDIVVVVEGFQKHDVDITRYSLSTKVADSLASGSNILVYGSMECGAIEYLKNIDSAAVCSQKEDLVDCIANLISNVEFQKRNYEMAAYFTQKHHNLLQSSEIFKGVVNKMVERKNRNMIKDKLSLLIHTCDKFSDLWDTHIMLLNKNWANRNIDTFLVSDNKPSKSFEGIKLLSAGEGKEFSERVAFSLPHIKTEYVLVTLDDYFLTKQIHTEKIASLIDVMEKEEIDYISLFNDPNSFDRMNGYKNIYNVNLIGNYKVNLYPGIWRKSFIEKTLNAPLNAWQYEVSLTKIARETGAKCVLSKGKEFPILDVVRKGKLLHKANRYLKKHHLYEGPRGVISYKDEFKIFVFSTGKKILPQGLANFIKRRLINKGFKFYSEID
ncbi:hypothetical protein [Neobacillus drentensis]|uniref:hypothetical protein n=1 Tax=Neobacillus drentensis TaxID=220684 RepID=UPI002FFD591F